MTKAFFSFFVLLSAGVALAQSGTIRGKIIDDASAEELIGATVVIEGTTKGSVTDFEGNFQIVVEPGTYNLVVSFVSFETLKITDVVVNPGQVISLGEVRIKEYVETLEAVVITAEAIKNSEQGLMTVKRKSANLLDGLSAQSFQKMGLGDAAAAANRVTGVSVEGGKYVFVRGLGDRYTKTTLNGMDIPGLDPDRNTLQMDLFPTSVLDNIVISKTFTADLSADFTGGIINLETKDFPEEKQRSISVSGGFNPSMHFNSNYLTYEGGSSDFLGFDDGTRRIPSDGVSDIPFITEVSNAERAQTFKSILNGFNTQLAAQQQTSFMDYGFSYTSGNQSEWKDYTVGYNFAFGYKYTTEFYQGAQFNRFAIPADKSSNELTPFDQQDGDYGTSEVLLSALAGLAFKKETTKYKLVLLHLQNGQSRAGTFDFIGSELGSNFEAVQHNLEYSQRSLTNLLVGGLHYFGSSKWNLEWNVSPTRSKIYDPDIRYTRYREDESNITIGTESGLPERIWRNLEEYNVASKVDLNRETTAFGREAKIKTGVANTVKFRDFLVEDFQIIPNGVTVTTDIDELMSDENLWDTDNTEGVYYTPNFLPNNTNEYEGMVNNSAAYVSMDVRPADKLRAVVGVRAEKFVQTYTGQGFTSTGLTQFTNEKVLNDFDLFPALNLVYSLTENQNLRLSATGTIARPSFKEASFATIYDPLTGRTFIGGFFRDVDVLQPDGEVVWDGNLQSTRIMNLDLRWEAFQKSGQMVSVSGFYKFFRDPIEMVQYIQAANNFQPRNVGDGQVFGAEWEVRQGLGQLTSALDKFTFSTNFTYTKSIITMTDPEYNSRIAVAREGQSIKDTRPMAGQAPLTLNMGLSYDNTTRNLEAGLFYNVQSATLHFVGISNRPDVYTVPFHSLDMTANKTFGVDGRMRLGANITNIIGSDRSYVYRIYKGKDEYFSSISPGTRISISYSYSF